MPGMGVPDALKSNGNFANIKMAEKTNGKNESTQETLNKLAGAQEGRSIFKDGKKHNQLGKDEFMKLLSHQMQNQDPFSPMDQTKMVGEMAAFAQLEQVTNLNGKFDELTKNQPNENKYIAASFLGKYVMTNGNTLSLKETGQSSDVHYNLEKDASKVFVRIFDAKNNMVGEIVKENVSRGSQVIEWNGKNLDNSPATKGDYTVQIFAYDKQYAQFNVQSKTTGKVTGVNFENGDTVLTVDGGKKVFLRDVDSFSMEQMKIEGTSSSAVNANQALQAYGQPKKIALPQAMNETANLEEGFDYGSDD